MARDIPGPEKEREGTSLPRGPRRIGGLAISVDEYSPGGRPLDVTIETRLNLITAADRVILSVKIAASGWRHLRQDSWSCLLGGFTPRKGGESK